MTRHRNSSSALGHRIAVIVFAQVAGKGGALIDADLLWAGGEGQHDEGIEAGLLGSGGAIDTATDCGASRIGAPPVIGCRNRTSGRRSAIVQIASDATCTVAREAA